MGSARLGEEEWRRLLQYLLQQRRWTDETFLAELFALPEEVTDLDAGAAGRAYDAALDRAATAARQHRKAIRKNRERAGKAIERIRADKPLWPHLGWPYVVALLELSFEARHRDPQAMHGLAQSAVNAAQNLSPAEHPPGVVADLRARALIELANACRVTERYPEAEAALRRAKEEMAQGSGDPGLLARRHDVKSSLRHAQRRLPEALELLDRAHQIYHELGERHLAGRILVSKGRVVYMAGDPAEAVRLLEEGMALLDRERDPRLAQTTLQSLIVGLVDAGQIGRAERLLLNSGLGAAFEDEPLNRLRLRWVEAKIQAGLDRLDRAEPLFREVRAGFREHGLEYDAALAGLDLAAVWLREGERGRLLPLATEMADTFLRLRLPTRDALLAVTFLKVACQKRVASLGLVERTRSFLARYRSDSRLKFDHEALFLG
jgi:tetratricopeptide (TPR) repeat protein